MPERSDENRTTLEPDTDNAGVGNGKADRIPFRPCESEGADRDTVFHFMKLTLNGEPFETNDEATVAEMLKQLDIEPSGVAVEVNLSIIKKSDYSVFRLKDGDKIEIVNFVGGG